MDATNGHINGEAPVNGETHMNGEAPLNGHANGYTIGHAAPVAEVPAPGNGHAAAEPEITRIRGSLGLGSASLAGKVALVTGSGTCQYSALNSLLPGLLSPCTGRGIGREMALELGRRGAKVVVNYANSSEAASEVVAEIKRSGSDAIALMANTSSVKDIISLFAQAVAHFGHLDIVCSNSGVVSFGHIKDVTEEEYDRVMNINTRGQFFVAREAYKHLSVGGRLIMMGSITGQAKGVPKHTLYSGSKGAIETFVRCMAMGELNSKIILKLD